MSNFAWLVSAKAADGFSQLLKAEAPYPHRSIRVRGTPRCLINLGCGPSRNSLLKISETVWPRVLPARLPTASRTLVSCTQLPTNMSLWPSIVAFPPLTCSCRPPLTLSLKSSALNRTLEPLRTTVWPPPWSYTYSFCSFASAFMPKGRVIREKA